MPNYILQKVLIPVTEMGKSYGSVDIPPESIAITIDPRVDERGFHTIFYLERSKQV